MKKSGIFILFLALIAVGTALAIPSQSHVEKQVVEAASENSIARQFIKPTRPFGGDFSLTNHLGKASKLSDYQNDYKLVYFGFTSCPDICPLDLSAMAVAYQDLPKDVQSKVQPVFVTVDPTRDTPEKLKTFLTSFDAPIVGMTGSDEEVNKVAKLYKVFHQHVDDAGDPQVNHSAYIYFMSPKNELIGLFSHPANPDVMVDVIQREIKNDQHS